MLALSYTLSLLGWTQKLFNNVTPKTLADVYLEEADELLSKGDIIQASEKYYKAAEEAIKILSYKNWVWR